MSSFRSTNHFGHAHFMIFILCPSNPIQCACPDPKLLFIHVSCVVPRIESTWDESNTDVTKLHHAGFVHDQETERRLHARKKSEVCDFVCMGPHARELTRARSCIISCGSKGRVRWSVQDIVRILAPFRIHLCCVRCRVCDSVCMGTLAHEN